MANTPYPVVQTAPDILAVPFSGMREDADRYPVAANTTVVLMNFSTYKFWVKSAGSNGLIQTFDEYDFKKVVYKDPNVVSREEFDSLSSSMSRIESMLNSLMAPPTKEG